MNDFQIELQALLAPYRLRLRLQNAVRMLAWGLVAGSVLALAFSANGWLAIGLLLACAIGSVIVGFALPVPWVKAALATDAAANLRDRTITAWELASQANPYRSLQHEDAVRHLKEASPRQVLPLKWPWLVRIGGAAMAMALAVIVPGMIADAGIVPEAKAEESPEYLKQEAANLEAMAEELEKFAELENVPELKEIAKEQRLLAKELRQPGMDVKTALAKMANLEQKLQEAMDKLNQDEKAKATDAGLKQVGKALESSENFSKAAQALQQGKYDQASKDLAEAAKKPMDALQAEAAKKKLAEISKKLESQGLQKLGTAAEKLSNAMPQGTEQRKEAVQDLKKEAEQQARRKRILEVMAKEKKRMEECKSRCQNQARNLLQQQNQPKDGNKSQAQSSGKANGKGSDQSAGGKNKANGQESNGPRKNGIEGEADQTKGDTRSGRSEGGDEDGPGSDGPRKRPNVSNYEIEKQMKQATEAMERSQVPLGHRQSIRKFFELMTAPGKTP